MPGHGRQSLRMGNQQKAKGITSPCVIDRRMSLVYYFFFSTFCTSLGVGVKVFPQFPLHHRFVINPVASVHFGTTRVAV